MKIWFSNNKLEKILCDDRQMVREFGADNAKKIKLRLQALLAAESLADFEPGTPPERCHELEGALVGTFSFDVKHPFRLLFKPTKCASPRPADRREFWKSISEIEIIDVRDTHG
jgi:proteic killer suppression protein